MHVAGSSDQRDPGHPLGGSLASEISNLAVQLLSEYTGRGPRRTHTVLGENLISVVMHDTLTKGERSLLRDGRTDLILSMRKAYQQTMRDELVSGVERITGRRVSAFLSDNHIEPDVAVEIFVLEPREPNGAQPGAPA